MTGKQPGEFPLEFRRIEAESDQRSEQHVARRAADRIETHDPHLRTRAATAVS